MPHNILITGGTGFIGSRLLETCLDHGENVRVLAQANTPAEEQNLKQIQSRGVEVILGSVTEPDTARKACQGIDTVYHLAAAQHEAGKPDEHFRNVNVTGTCNILDAAVAENVQRFVHGSTIGVYQADRGTVRDDTPAVPDNIYGITKLEAEKRVVQYHEKLPIAIIRISETYGPGDRRLLKLFKGIAAGKFFHIGREQNLHHPVYIDDLINAFRAAASVPADHLPQTPMVAPGYEALTTRQMIQDIAAALGVKSPRLTVPLMPLWSAAVVMETALRPLGINPPLHRRRMHFFTKSFQFDGHDARRALNYQPAVPFAEGAKRTAEWYRAANLLN